jgi:hypothetical protein
MNSFISHIQKVSQQIILKVNPIFAIISQNLILNVA